MCVKPLGILLVIAMVLSPMSLAAEVEYLLTQRIHQTISAEVWDKHSSTDEDGEVVVAFYVDYSGKATEISVVSSNPPGVWDNLAKEHVESLKFRGARTGYRQISMGYSKGQNQ